MQNQLTEAHRAATRKWYAANKAKHKVLRDAYRAANRVRIRAQNTAWRKRNLARMCAHVVAYNARKRKAMPAWANRDAIQRIYENCPPDHQVDHIIPLRGKLVSGLHVETNLQYLPGVENNRKGNRYAT
jgi:5-methylcytosine-specific restriction endonuclease McrA